MNRLEDLMAVYRLYRRWKHSRWHALRQAIRICRREPS